ncbi:geranylgeranyl transferase type-2 subunit alpha [Marchantia polymorpha subsp. ruderalis]|uniref:Geranylgeranyl transferase type-2 subunit alpha n=1 Tax=Marchantia polymorpha TaxID=3197 RepID=A0A2R6W4Y5_MARPO|nr:hypothetical protein MARPO_0151s0003 [Marchantia polymorpha]PTQ28926.1 hypothetical protein MARPO_0151s0003 [Marchantia polymorpha]BBN19938.1 hypothetical protein Mp_8g15030 [Marchantia polymorpha subsp. ruderalis]BBN19939.1 hypothetical protein Mp_8g15030 [Marchantia polymorpha subsp. ruderalis]|eukprot:PTQ28925.1 hypothetical protein MARPO_0151s0003 [Marchantia polymorpha]
MHGRKRIPIGQAADKGKDQTKTNNLKKLLSDFLRNHHERCYSKEALKQNAQLLELNPEVYTAWNYRKLAVRHLFESEIDEAARKLILDEELQLVERALQSNVKSYGAWHHRKWVIDFGLSSLDHEFMLLKMLLKADCRNFHGWNYRRFCVEMKGMTPEKELEYATEKINENFSNYSAWHYRSKLLSPLIKGKENKEDVLNEEYRLVNQAYFTEPDDQSAWFYNTWLLGETKIESGPHVVGSWPEDGSSISVDAQEGSSFVAVNFRTPLDSEHRFESRTLTLVIYFNEEFSDVAATIRSKPELPHLSEVQWRSVSGTEAPSRAWLADIPVQSFAETEYTFFVEVSSPKECQNTPISFKLKYTKRGTSEVSRDQNSRSECYSWPSKKSSSDESQVGMRLELERLTVDPSSAEPGSIKQDPTRYLRRDNWQETVLEEQVDILRELLELEENSKWTLLTLARVLAAHGASRYTDEVLKLYKRLPDIDPDHADYYKAQYSILYVDKITRSPDILQKLWWDVEDRLSAGWLRWNGLSLSDFRSVERLLWVQRLDLSHNQLRTVDGLEAMQLLVALDVSHNKLPNITSLASLRLIPSLQYLNISQNEIGDHQVDATRYSFPSVLTNQMCFSSLSKGNVNAERSWELQAVFGGMNLKVLDIAGNSVASDEIFRETIVRALPQLELLDGEQVKR